MRANLGLTEPEIKQAIKSKKDKLKEVLSEDYDKNSLYWKFAGGFLVFFILGCMYVFLSLDTFLPFVRVQPKDYAAEEVQNIARANKKDDFTAKPLVDENAEQFVNDVDNEETEETETEETETIPEETAKEAEVVAGEDF